MDSKYVTSHTEHAPKLKKRNQVKRGNPMTFLEPSSDLDPTEKIKSITFEFNESDRKKYSNKGRATHLEPSYTEMSDKKKFPYKSLIDKWIKPNTSRVEDSNKVSK